MAKSKGTDARVTESEADVESWAVELIAAIGTKQARTVLGDYKRLAADKQLSEFDRAAAKQRAKILAKSL